MPFLTDILGLVPPLAWQTAAAVVALVVAVFALRGLRTLTRAANQFFHRYVAPRPAEDVLTVVAAAIATGVSAQGMWRFSGDVLGFDGPLRLLLFAFIEVAVITSAVRARRNMREKYSAGIDGIAVWTLTGLSAALSSMDARSLPEAVFRLAAPLVAAWLWERGMAVERHRATGRKRINWRLTPERMLVRVGLAEAQDRTASEVDAHRRLTRVAFAAKKARRLEAMGAAAWRQRRALSLLGKRVEKAVEHADLASNAERQYAMLDRISAVIGAEDLRHVAPIAPWATLNHPAVTTPPPREAPDANLLSEALAQWSAHYRKTGPETVADRDHAATGRRPVRDQDATTPATTPPLSALGRMIRPGDPRPVGHLAAFDLPPRPARQPARRPFGDRLGLPPSIGKPAADKTCPAPNPGAEPAADATDPRPVTDRKRPDEQDRRQAIRFYIKAAKKLNPPSKRTLAEWSGFSETWALGCIQEGRQQMTQQGWTFDDRGTPTPPAEAVAEVVATTPVSATASVNGSSSAGGAA